MALGTWWVGDILPILPALPTFSISSTTELDIQMIASLTGLSYEEIQARWHNGNTAYLALLDKIPVAYGWMGTGKSGVREIKLAFTVPPHNRYLWDFQTLPEWRGQGIYPLFLQEIIRANMHLADRFWILYEPGNEIAARAISRAGFVFVGELVLKEGQVSSIQLFNQDERALAGAVFLHLPVETEE